jgi:hypothetical protein
MTAAVLSCVCAQKAISYNGSFIIPNQLHSDSFAGVVDDFCDSFVSGVWHRDGAPHNQGGEGQSDNAGFQTKEFVSHG